MAAYALTTAHPCPSPARQVGPVTAAIGAVRAAHEPQIDPARRGALLTVVAATIAGMPGLRLMPSDDPAHPGARVHPDAELVRLGRLLDAAWADERDALEAARRSKDAATDALWEAACDRTGLVVDAIEAMAATTVDGLKAKARACLWCHNGEPFGDASFDEQATTDVRLAAGILRDLLAIGAT